MPAICVQRCSVSQVSLQAASGRSGQRAFAVIGWSSEGNVVPGSLALAGSSAAENPPRWFRETKDAYDRRGDLRALGRAIKARVTKDRGVSARRRSVSAPGARLPADLVSRAQTATGRQRTRSISLRSRMSSAPMTSAARRLRGRPENPSRGGTSATPAFTRAAGRPRRSREIGIDQAPEY